MTFLEQLWRARPVAERIPPRALASDKIPWSGDEAAKFGEIFADARAFAEPSRRLHSFDPKNPELETARIALAHLSARWHALMESWDPQGPAN
jgi:hypothetical protein